MKAATSIATSALASKEGLHRLWCHTAGQRRRPRRATVSHLPFGSLSASKRVPVLPLESSQQRGQQQVAIGKIVPCYSKFEPGSFNIATGTLSHLPLSRKTPCFTLKQTPPIARRRISTTFVVCEAQMEAAPNESPPPPPPLPPPGIQWTTHRLNTTQIAKVDAVFHKILWLDLFETATLNELVNERMDLIMTPKQHNQLAAYMETRAEGNDSASAGAASSDEPVELKPILFDLKLASFDAAAKIKVIKEVRSILGLGLKEAKEMVESAPVIIQKGLKPENAEELKTKLEAVGAQVELM